jgi:hypothetical protein
VTEIRLKKLAVFFMKVILKESGRWRHLMKGAFEETLSGGLCGAAIGKEKSGPVVARPLLVGHEVQSTSEGVAGRLVDDSRDLCRLLKYDHVTS